MKHAQLRYRPDTERWSITAGGKEYGVHCGESFILNTGGARIPCRLELADTAYSGAKKPPVPENHGHPFRLIAATRSGNSRPPIPENHGHFVSPLA